MHACHANHTNSYIYQLVQTRFRIKYDVRDKIKMYFAQSKFTCFTHQRNVLLVQLNTNIIAIKYSKKFFIFSHRKNMVVFNKILVIFIIIIFFSQLFSS